MTHCSTARSRGFTFVEVVVAAAMLAVLLGLGGRMLVQARVNARMVEHRELALRTVGNALEELAAGRWDAIDEGAIDELSLPESLSRRWPEARLTGSVEEVGEPVEAKRLSLTLRLTPRQPALAATLTTWVYRAPREEAN